MNNKMLVTAIHGAPKSIQEALDLANRTSGPLKVPVEALSLTITGGIIEVEGETWPNDSK